MPIWNSYEMEIISIIMVHFLPFLTLDTELDAEVAAAEVGDDCDWPVMSATKPSRSFLRLASLSLMLLWRLFKAWMSLQVSDMVYCKFTTKKERKVNFI